MQIKIVRCPRCGEIQGSLAEKIFQCKFCGVKRKMKHVKVLKKTKDPEKARLVINKLRIKFKVI